MQEVVNVAALGSIYLLFALGMSLVWGTLGILNFAHGSIFMFAAFTNFLLLQHVSLPLGGLLVVGPLSGAATALLIQVLAFSPILKRAKDRATAERQLLICGIGLASIPISIAEIHTRGTPFGFARSSFELSSLTVGGVRVSSIQLVIIAAGAFLAAATAVWMRRSRTGLALRTIGIDPEVAAMMGVNTRRLALVTVVLSGALAGLGGTLLTLHFGAIDPQSGGILLLKAFAIIILGGVGSIEGTVVASFLLAGAETAVLTWTSGTWVDAISFGLLFLVLIARPQGVFGRQEVRRT